MARSRPSATCCTALLLALLVCSAALATAGETSDVQPLTAIGSCRRACYRRADRFMHEKYVRASMQKSSTLCQRTNTVDAKRECGHVEVLQPFTPSSHGEFALTRHPLPLSPWSTAKDKANKPGKGPKPSKPGKGGCKNKSCPREGTVCKDTPNKKPGYQCVCAPGWEVRGSERSRSCFPGRCSERGGSRQACCAIDAVKVLMHL